MEFQGRVMKLLPMRSGISSKTGNEWRAQPFVFEYFENPDQRFSDKVVLETLDEKIIAQLVENQECRIGFGHRIREYNGNTFNAPYIYKFEIVNQSNQNVNQENNPKRSDSKESTSAPQNEASEVQKDGNDLPF